MEKERKFEGVWNAEKLLQNYIYFADENGSILDLNKYEISSYKIKQQRFLAAMKAYGKNAECLYREESERGFHGDYTSYLLSQTRSEKKIKELSELLKQIVIHEHDIQYVGGLDFPKDIDGSIHIMFRMLFKYRKKLFDLNHIWAGLLECSRPVGMIYSATRSLNYKYIHPVCEIVDRMLILLMGDDYDKSFTEKGLFQFGYPDVTDDELYQMELEEF